MKDATDQVDLDGFCLRAVQMVANCHGTGATRCFSDPDLSSAPPAQPVILTQI
jgi:hypothetical protein